MTLSRQKIQYLLTVISRVLKSPLYVIELTNPKSSTLVPAVLL